MNATVSSGIPMPIIGSVEALEPYKIKVVWREGSRAGRTDIVDLFSLIDDFTFYRPLRGNGALFATAHVAQEGNAVAWLADDELDMAATAIERLAIEGVPREAPATTA